MEATYDFLITQAGLNLNEHQAKQVYALSKMTIPDENGDGPIKY